jgi:hypothetical protein
MDLPTCPSCGQSVLDDDAVDCPFCGSSMSAKPGVAASKPAAPQPTQKKATRKKAEAAPAGDPDDPFGVSAPVMSKAVALLPKPVKGKLHRIVCPMCETPGFQSKKAAGREVKCANKECLVPIFTAPPLEGEEAEEAPRVDTAVEEKKSGGPLLLYGGVTVVMLAIGGVAWFMNKPQSTAGLDAPYVPPVTSNVGGETITDPSLDPATASTPDTKAEAEPQPPEPVGPSAEELRAEAIKLMNTVSLIRDRNSRKPYCRRMTAEAQALTGDLAGVDTQLQQLAIVGPTLKFYGVPPLVETGWQHLTAGRTAELNATIKRIQEPLDSVPEYGTIAVSMMVDYAGLLAAAGQTAKAIAAIKRRRNVAELGQFVETWSRSLVAPRLSFAAALSQRPVTGWSEPQWATVAFNLSCRGSSDEAVIWADLAPTPRAKTECISAWAEGQMLTLGVAAQTLIDQQISGLPPADQAFVLARCQLARALSSDADTSSVLAKAIETLKSVGTPGTVPMPKLKSETKLDLPDAEPLTSAAVAAAEIAHVQQLLGQADAAWESIMLAQNWARAISPSPAQTQAPLTEISRLGPSQIQALLKVSLNLLSDSDAQNAYLEYRNRCNRLNEVATSRFALQQKILAAAASWGLTEKVWTEINARAAGGAEPASAEPWFDTNLPARLHAQFQAGKQDAQKTAIEQSVTVDRLRTNNDVSVPTALLAEINISGGKLKDAARVLEQFAADNREDRDQRFQQETALRLASELTGSGKPDQAIQFAVAFQKSPQLSEEMLQTIGAEATTAGKPLAAMVPARGEELTPPERISLLRGLVGALQESSQ